MQDGTQNAIAPGGAPSGLIADYRPIPGVPDEMMDAGGGLRPGWGKLISALEALGPSELSRRFETADQYLRDAGVFYRTYDGGAATEREWPLAHIPLLLQEAEWRRLSAGLIQRAELLESIVSDIYGENRLVRDGLIPPELIASSPEFLRPVAGVKPAGGHFLQFVAFELGRGPDGEWWVLGDRTQAPSGAGFALENRVAVNRSLADLYAEMNVMRLAGFFREFRDTLAALSSRTEGGVAILSPGPLNETYFEHAYIARYLGIMLLEGEDLTVDAGRVMVRTVSGLKPVDVLWRRMDAAFTDPLELNYDSHIGTPGLLTAVRNGSLHMVNALGSGILETRALGAFLGGISRAVRGEELALPSVATWWCGQEAERRHVLDNFDELVIGPAFSTLPPFEDTGASVLGGTLDPQTREARRAEIAANGSAFVGQEAAKLSTAPVFVRDRLEPRPVSFRAFAARTERGWIVMPGGFGRVGHSLDPTAITMKRGGEAADVWVIGEKPVELVSLLRGDDTEISRNAAGDLPSRAADNLIWLGRYIERGEQLVRVLRAYHIRLSEAGHADLPVLVDVRAYLGRDGIDTAEPIPDGLLASIDSAISSAGQIRDRFSPDGWLALNDLAKTVHRFRGALVPGADTSRAMTVLLRKLAGFSGLAYENMYRFAGWRFLEIGRRLERAGTMAALSAWMTRPGAADGALEMLLEIGDSVMTHRRRYSVGSGHLSVVDLLILDPLNPRSVAFQLGELREQIEQLPGGIVDGQRSQTAKEALRLATDLAIAEPARMRPEALERLAADIAGLAALIDRAYFTQG